MQLFHETTNLSVSSIIHFLFHLSFHHYNITSNHHFSQPTILHPHPSLNPNFASNKESPPEYLIEVIARIRDYPDWKDKPLSVLQASSNSRSIRVRADFWYMDFTLDGVSGSEEEEFDLFYKKFMESRINGVKLGDKCTIMIYGLTGYGKSHPMFGCAKQAGIVYKALRDILRDGDIDSEISGDGRYSDSIGLRTFVQVTVLEIYNEEIYDLLTTNGERKGKEEDEVDLERVFFFSGYNIRSRAYNNI